MLSLNFHKKFLFSMLLMTILIATIGVVSTYAIGTTEPETTSEAELLDDMLNFHGDISTWFDDPGNHDYYFRVPEFHDGSVKEFSPLGLEIEQEINSFDHETIQARSHFSPTSPNPTQINFSSGDHYFENFYDMKMINLGRTTNHPDGENYEDYYSMRVFYNTHGGGVNFRTFGWTKADWEAEEDAIYSNFASEYEEEQEFSFGVIGAGTWTTYDEIKLNGIGYDEIKVYTVGDGSAETIEEIYSVVPDDPTDWYEYTVSTDTMRPYVFHGSNDYIVGLYFEDELIFSTPFTINYDPSAGSDEFFLTITPIDHDWKSAQTLNFESKNIAKLNIYVNDSLMPELYPIRDEVDTVTLNKSYFETILKPGTNTLTVTVFDQTEPGALSETYFFDIYVDYKIDPTTGEVIGTGPEPPVLPSDAGVVDYFKYIYDYLNYVLISMGNMLSNTISILGSMIDEFTTLFEILAMWFSFLPSELLAVLVAGMSLMIVVSVIRILRGS